MTFDHRFSVRSGPIASWSHLSLSRSWIRFGGFLPSLSARFHLCIREIPTHGPYFEVRSNCFSSLMIFSLSKSDKTVSEEGVMVVCECCASLVDLAEDLARVGDC